MAVGALEKPFWADLLAGLGLNPDEFVHREDPAGWPAIRARFTALFVTRTRDEWASVFAGTDACVTPVLTFAEAPDDPHLAARQSVIELDGVHQSAPAPRFSRSRTATPTPPPVPGHDTKAVLADWEAPGVQVRLLDGAHGWTQTCRVGR